MSETQKQIKGKQNYMWMIVLGAVVLIGVIGLIGSAVLSSGPKKNTNIDYDTSFPTKAAEQTDVAVTRVPTATPTALPTRPPAKPTAINFDNYDRNKLEEVFATSFMNDCNKDGTMFETCSCLLNYLTSHYSLEERVAMGQEYERTGRIPQGLYDAVNSCPAR
jgi:hypothetical protein